MERKGISPLIATVLIIGLVVALAAVIMMWGSSFVQKLQSGSETVALESMSCSMDVMVDLRSACFMGDDLVVMVENAGTADFDGLLFRFYGSVGGSSDESGEPLGSLDIKSFKLSFDNSKVGDLEKVEVFPLVKFEDKTLYCSNNYDEYATFLNCREGYETANLVSVGGEVVCSSDADCGVSDYEGDSFCKDGDVYKNYKTFTCLNPGSTDSQCTSEITENLISDCQEGENCVEGQDECQALPTCSDGTPYGECSATQPKFCDNGELVDDCQTCGCTGIDDICSYGYGTCSTPNLMQDGLWVARYNGPANSYDSARAITLDNSGNVYVTGTSYGTNSDYLTIKYDNNGNKIWEARYDRGKSDDVYAIAVDSSGNVYITGRSDGSRMGDISTVKYNSNGVQQWAKVYNGPLDEGDYGKDIALDTSGNVFILGSSLESSYMVEDMVIIKYAPDGTELWRQKHGYSSAWDYPGAIAVDSEGNAYITGSAPGYNDIALVKYEGNTGAKLFEQRYHYGFDRNFGYDIAVDSTGVYITGEGRDTTNWRYDYITLKYDKTTGQQKWAKIYDSPSTQYDEDHAKALAIDDTGVYVTGYSYNYEGGTKNNWVTIKYDKSTGNQLWLATYNGPTNGDDSAYDIAVDSLGNVYVTGSTSSTGTNNDYATIKYDTNGNQLWITSYNGPANGYDTASAIATDTSGNIYITGISPGINTNNDYATIKYCADLDRNEICDTV